MKKFLFMMLVVCLTACSIPKAIKEADVKAIESETVFLIANDTLFERVLEAYKKEAVGNIMFRAELARKQGQPKEDIQKFLREKTKELLAILEKVVKAYNENRKNLQNSVELRTKISEYLESKADVKGIMKLIMKEIGNE